MNEQPPGNQEAQAKLQDDVTPLTEDEIEEAKIKITKLHPLANTKIEQVFPLFGCCFKIMFSCCRTKHREKMDKLRVLMKEEQEFQEKKISDTLAENNIRFEGSGPIVSANGSQQNSADLEENPFNTLGFGFQAYFSTLKIFTVVFTLMSLIMIPAFYYYKSNQGLYKADPGKLTANTNFFLGDLGFSQPICISTYVNVDAPKTIGCSVGLMSQLYSVGIIPNNIEPGVYSRQQAKVQPTPLYGNAYSYCDNITSGVESPPTNSDTILCTQNALDTGAFYDYFNTNCLNHQKCNLTTTQFLSNSTTLTQCTTGSARVFYQYICEQTTEAVTTTRERALLVVCLGMFAVTIFMITVYYMTKTSQMDYKLWDLRTTTATDFTVEIVISATQWVQYNIEKSRHLLLPPGNSSPNHTETNASSSTFCNFLEHTLCAKLNSMPKLIEDVDIKISNITLGFNNPELLKLLISRGSLITSGKFTKLEEMNEKIEKYVKDHKEELTKPVAAFITFEREEGKNRALTYFCKPVPLKQSNEEGSAPLIQPEPFKLLGETLIAKEAPEPSEILWHNRGMTAARQNCHKVVVFFAILIVLLIAFFFFTYLKTFTVHNQIKYPPQQSCPSVDAQFNNNMTNYEVMAKLDQTYTLAFQGTGIYQCYCRSQSSLGDFANTDALCHQYQWDMQGGYAISESVSVAVTVVNTIIRTINIILIKFVGYHTESSEITAIMISIFVATFFNTAILLLLADADLTQNPGLSWIPLRGPYPDLTENWYLNIAPSLIFTMLLNSVYLYIEFAIAFGTKALFRAMDQGWKIYCCCKPNKKTKKKTIQEYVNLYSGPQHVMHFKYAAILTTVFVTLMYGYAIPMLFPIAAFTFLNYYIVDKLLITYFYQKPPVYDDKLNTAALSLMKYAPLFMMFFGYWCMGNKQIFNNQANPLSHSNVPITTGHTVAPTASVDLPLFIAGFFVLFVIIFTDIFQKCLIKCRIMEQESEIEVDEKLGSYFECLSVVDRKIWLAEEANNNRKLGIRTVGDWTMDKLRLTFGGKKVVKNAPNYEILANPNYQAAFQYTPIEMRNTPEEVEFSETVTRVMYMGYAREGFQDIQFKNLPASRGRSSSFAKRANGVNPASGPLSGDNQIFVQ